MVSRASDSCLCVSDPCRSPQFVVKLDTLKVTVVFGMVPLRSPLVLSMYSCILQKHSMDVLCGDECEPCLRTMKLGCVAKVSYIWLC